MTLLMRIAERALNRPLMVHPDKLPILMDVLHGRIPIENLPEWRRAADQNISEMPDAARATMLGPNPTASRFVGSYVETDPVTGAKTTLPYKRAGGVAIIPVIGSLVNRGAWLGSYSGATSYEGLRFQVAHAAGDPNTKAVILDIDSPGGEAVGCFECAAAIRDLAETKPVTAVVNGMAASAAYAIASAADKIITTESGVSGAIGVVLLHADYSAKLKKDGIAPTLIFAGAHKVDGNPFEPLSDDVHADLQAEVDQFYQLFVSGVASGRAMTETAIRATEARTFIGEDAVREGLADAVGSFDATFESHVEASRKIARQAPDHQLTMRAPDRIDISASILALPEAKGREQVAKAYARAPGGTIEGARAFLATVPKTLSFEERRAKRGPLGLELDMPSSGSGVGIVVQENAGRADRGARSPAEVAAVINAETNRR